LNRRLALLVSVISPFAVKRQYQNVLPIFLSVHVPVISTGDSSETRASSLFESVNVTNFAKYIDCSGSLCDRFRLLVSQEMIAARREPHRFTGAEVSDGEIGLFRNAKVFLRERSSRHRGIAGKLIGWRLPSVPYLNECHNRRRGLKIFDLYFNWENVCAQGSLGVAFTGFPKCPSSNEQSNGEYGHYKSAQGHYNFAVALCALDEIVPPILHRKIHFSGKRDVSASENSPFFEIARVLVRFDDAARLIVNANHAIF
jgi:hypothetical protein